jgi:ParB family chromosome partitioning protein
LSALIPSKPPVSGAGSPSAGGDGILEIPIEAIDPNPIQPRTIFQPESLRELAQSIQTSGVIQPLIVRRSGPRFQLVAGERRWRASKLAGLKTVPVVIRDIKDEHLLEITLIENLQREDLNPMEVAHAFDRLSRELSLSHEEIGRRTGKDRASITNTLRLLRLPMDVQQLIADRRLSMGHARAILGLPSEDLQRQVAEKAGSQGLSVRQVERMIQRITETREPQPAEAASEDPNVRAATDELQRVLGTRVRIVPKSEDRGRIEIEYYSPEDLDRIYSVIVRE